MHVNIMIYICKEEVDFMLCYHKVVTVNCMEHVLYINSTDFPPANLLIKVSINQSINQKQAQKKKPATKSDFTEKQAQSHL